MRKHVFILNPNAGDQKGIRNLYDKLATIQATSIEEVEVIFTKEEKDVDKIFERLDMESDYRFYACGGDGTLHALVKHCVHEPRYSLVPIPLGSGNDFVRAFDIPRSDFFQIEKLMEKESMRIDTLRVNQHYCINTASVGLDATIAEITNTIKEKTFIKGSVGYIIAFLLSLATRIRYKLDFTVDEKQMPITDYNFFVAANGRYYGGGFEAAPTASVDDGLMDIISIEALKRTKILRLAPVYRAGKHLPLTDIITHQLAKRVEIHSDIPLAMNLDGDVDHAKDIVIEVQPKSLHIVLP